MGLNDFIERVLPSPRNSNLFFSILIVEWHSAAQRRVAERQARSH